MGLNIFLYPFLRLLAISLNHIKIYA